MGDEMTRFVGRHPALGAPYGVRKNLWALRTADGRIVHLGFATKDAAKRERDLLAASGDTGLFVTPGPDHKRFDVPPPQNFQRKERRW